MARIAVPAVLIGLLAAASLPATALAQGGSISGTVVNAGGSGVRGVEVDLLGAVSESGWGARSVTTDGSGQFTFSGVADGTYGLSILSDGSCGANQQTYVYTAGGAVTRDAQAAPIAVSGADVSGLTLTCPKTYSISGKALAPNGSGVEGILVYAENWPLDGRAYTAADGSFTISGLEAGSYIISADDYNGAFYQSGWISKSGFVEQRDWATAFKLGPRNISNLRVRLKPALTISGTITAPDGQPAAGLSVYYGPGYVVAPGHMVTTAQDGTYTISGGLPGEVGYLEVTNPNNGYEPAFWSLRGATANQAEANQLSLGAGSISNVDLQVSPAVGISGTLVDANSQPMPDSTIAALMLVNGAISDSPFAVPVSAQVGSDGTFKLAAMVPGSYVLAIYTPDGRQAYCAAGGAVTDAARATAVVMGTSDVTGVDIVFNPTYYTITGTLTGSDGNPIAGAQVSLSGGNGAWGQTDGEGNLSIPNVAPGKYKIYLSLWSSPYVDGWWTGSGFVHDDSKAQTIDVTSDMSLNLVAPLGEHITGRVTDKNGIGLDTFVLAMDAPLSEDGMSLAGVESRGDGSFDLLVPAGSYAVATQSGGQLIASGYYSATSPAGFTLDWAKATHVASSPAGGQAILMADPPAATLSVRLVDSAGRPYIGTDARLFPVGLGRWISAFQTNPAGIASVPIDAGRYTLQVGGNDKGAGNNGAVVLQFARPTRSQSGWYRAQGSGHFTSLSTRASTIVITDKGPSLVIAIPESVAISGTVTSAGKPLGGMAVQALDPSTGQVVASTATAPNGAYSIAGLNSDSYVVRFLDPSGTYATGFYAKKGTVSTIGQAAVLHLGASNMAGVDADLSLAPTS